MPRPGTYFYRLPTVPTSSVFAVTVSLTIGCVRPLTQPEYPTHQMMGTGDVQYFPVGTEFKLSPEEARLQVIHAGKKIAIRLCRHYPAMPGSSIGTCLSRSYDSGNRDVALQYRAVSNTIPCEHGEPAVTTERRRPLN